MEWRVLPSLSSLRAFSAVAEKKSFSAAGRELNVSHAAVSQQVRALEVHLGVKLAVRDGRGVALTGDGHVLAAGLQDAFSRIQDAVESIQGHQNSRPVNITMTPTFAVSWLMPRISDFRGQHPDIDLSLNPTAEVVQFEPGGVDVAIRYGDGNWPGLEAELLLPTHFVIVGASRLVGDREFRTAGDLLDFPWLQELGTNELALWMKSQGVVPTSRLSVTHLPGYMVLEGLRRGDGITATAKVFLEPDIEAGSLKVLFEDRHSPKTGYYIVTRPGVQRPPLKAFVSWLRRHGKETGAA